MRTQLPVWPFLATFYGFPLWWVLGIAWLVPVAAAITMLGYLVLYRRTRVPNGALPLVLFFGWTLASVLALDSGLRLLGAGLRWAQFFAAVVMVIYVANAARLRRSQVLIGFSIVFFTTVVGGVLSQIIPEVRIPTILGAVAPGALRNNPLVFDLLNPKMAEIQMPWGAEEPFLRPAAPFEYTNGWGTAFALTLPLVIAAAIVLRNRGFTTLVVIGLAAALIPVTASTNRGMLVAIGVSATYVLVRLFFGGRAREAALGLLLMVVMLIVAASAGLFAGIDERQAVSDTTTGRSTLYEETFNRSLESPLLGHGGPRPSETTEVSAGTQGQVWFVMFSYGFVGLGLFLWFIWGAAWRTRRTVDLPDLLMHSSLIAACVVVMYYGLATWQLLVISAVAGWGFRSVADRVAETTITS